METHALAPLFVESARNQLSSIITSFADVLDRADPPPYYRKLERGENKILKKLGCSTKNDSILWRSLFLPMYFKSDQDGSMLWEVIGEGSIRNMLFSGKAWLDETEYESTATEKYEEKKELRQRVRKIMADSDSEDDMWEQMIHDHMSEDAEF